MRKPLQLIILLLFVCPFMLKAQDNNLLAKLAYENAETALSEKKFTEGISELKKVDDLLGKLTPKSQYLRIQLYIGAAETNGAYLDSAIEQSKKYLSLAKSFEIPEEKQMETLRQLQKMEKDKVVYDKKAKEEADAKAFLQTIETTAATHDQKAISTLIGLDMEKDILEQLVQSDRLARKAINYYKSHQSNITYSYLHQGKNYSIPVHYYSFLASKVLVYRINGLDTPLLIDTCFTTADGSFQELKISFLNWIPNRLETYVDQLSSILGFKPDAQVYLDAEAKTKYVSCPVWMFKDYTVALVQYSDTYNITKGEPYSLRIMRHYPGKANVLNTVTLFPWK